ncbi:SDR family NAD(P)-dependent oxidoreductase [Salinispira pacifica]
MPALLEQKTVVVAGGTGSVGEGLVRAFLEEGATVVVPCRSPAKQERLRQYVEGPGSEQLVCIPGNVGDEGSCAEFWAQVDNRYPTVDMGIACLGGWYYGYSLHRMPIDDWNRVIGDNLTSHFLFMRQCLSRFHARGTGTYVMINGGASQIVAPESGAISIVAAAQQMMTKVIAEEARGTRVRAYSVVAFNPVKTRERGANVVDAWVTGEDLGRYISRLYLGRGLPTDQVVHTVKTVADLPWAVNA